MGGRGIDHAHLGVLDQRHRLARGLVRQTENDDVGAVQGGGPGARVLALGIAQLDDGEVAASGSLSRISSPGGARGTVDENFLGHGRDLPTD